MQLSKFIAVCGKGETDVSIHIVLPAYNQYSYESIQKHNYSTTGSTLYPT